MDPDTIKKLIAVIDERIRTNTEQVKLLSAAIAEGQKIKEILVTKLKGAEEQAKPKKKRK